MRSWLYCVNHSFTSTVARCWTFNVHYAISTLFTYQLDTVKPYIGVGDGGRGHLPPPPQKKKSGKYFSGKNHVKFGHFANFSGKYHVKFGHIVNFSCIYFRAKMSCPPKLTELLRLWSHRSKVAYINYLINEGIQSYSVYWLLTGNRRRPRERPTVSFKWPWNDLTSPHISHVVCQLRN